MLDKWNSNPEYNWTMKKNNHHNHNCLNTDMKHARFHITHSNGHLQLQWGFKVLQPFYGHSWGLKS